MRSTPSDAAWSPGLLSPLREVARYCGVSERTIRKWRQCHRFPLMHLPSGRAVTSMWLIDGWLLERLAQEQQLPSRLRHSKPPDASVWTMRFPKRTEGQM
jgi:transposase-like protein